MGWHFCSNPLEKKSENITENGVTRSNLGPGGTGL